MLLIRGKLGVVVLKELTMNRSDSGVLSLNRSDVYDNNHNDNHYMEQDASHTSFRLKS